MDTAQEQTICRNTLCTKHGLKICTRCRAAWYCSKECQKDHWGRHKLCCKMISSSPEMRLRFEKAVNNFNNTVYQHGRGDYDQTLLILQESLEIFKEFYNDVLIADGYYEIGCVLFRKKTYEEALVNFRKALEMFKEMYGENYIQNCSCYEAIGNVLGDQGRCDDALIGYGKALAIRINLFGEDHLDIGRSYYNIGITQSKKRDYDGAMISFQKARAIFNRELGVQHPQTVQTNVYFDYCQKRIDR